MQINDAVFIPHNSNKRIEVLISDADYDAVPLKKDGKYTAHIAARDFILLKSPVEIEKHGMKGHLKWGNILFSIKILSLTNTSTYTFPFTILDSQTIPVNPVRLCIESDIHPNDENRHWHCSLLRNNMTLTEFVEIHSTNKENNGKIIIDSSLGLCERNREETDYGIFLKYCDGSCVVFYFVAFCIDSEDSFMNCYVSSLDEAQDKQKVFKICHDLYLNDLHQKRSHYRIIHGRNVLYYDVSKKSHDKNGNFIENIRNRTIEITIEQWRIQAYMRAMSKGEYESLHSPKIDETFTFTENTTIEKFVTYELEKEYVWMTVKSVLALPNPPEILLEFVCDNIPIKIGKVEPDYGEQGGGMEMIVEFTPKDTCTVKGKFDLQADFSIVLCDVENSKQYGATIIPNNHDDINFESTYGNHFICSADIEGKVKYYYLVKTEADIYKVLTVNDDFLKIFLTDKYYPEYLKKNQEALLKVRIKEGN